MSRDEKQRSIAALQRHIEGALGRLPLQHRHLIVLRDLSNSLKKGVCNEVCLKHAVIVLELVTNGRSDLPQEEKSEVAAFLARLEGLLIDVVGPNWWPAHFNVKETSGKKKTKNHKRGDLPETGTGGGQAHQ